MNRLWTLLRDLGALREGHFELPGTGHVDTYFDCPRLFQYPHLTEQAAAMLFDKVADAAADFVFTPSASSLPLAFELSRLGRKQFVLHERPFEDAGFRFPAGSSILVVEDVVVSGRSLDLARAWCEHRGATVERFAVLVDRRPPEDDLHAGLPVASVIRHPVRAWADSATCPMCREGVPLVTIAPNYPRRVVGS